MPTPSPPPIRLRHARPEDAALLLAWRNDEQTRRMSIDTRPVAEPEHRQWLAAALQDPDRRLFVAEAGGVPIGTTRLDRRPDAWSISITVAPGQRGAGHGGALLRLTAAWFDTHIGGAVIVAAVKRSNAASLALFLRNGYVVAAEDSALVQLELHRGGLPAPGRGASPPIKPAAASS